MDAGVTTPAGAGPVAEEAAKLFEALQGWARGFTADHARGPADDESSEGAAPAVGSAVCCRVCPVCQLLALVRDARPEAFDHLADAVGSLTLALRAALEGHTEARAADPRPARRVEPIDVR